MFCFEVADAGGGRIDVLISVESVWLWESAGGEREERERISAEFELRRLERRLEKKCHGWLLLAS